MKHTVTGSSAPVSLQTNPLLLKKSVSIYWGNIDGWLVSFRRALLLRLTCGRPCPGGQASTLRLTPPPGPRGEAAAGVRREGGGGVLHNGRKFTPETGLKEHL